MPSTTPAVTLDHAYYCTPRPDQDGPRIEQYAVSKYGNDGVTKVGEIHCVRCMECSATAYDGVQPEWH